MNLKCLSWFKKEEKKSLTDRALERYSQGKPVSKHAKGMFANETVETYRQRFTKARNTVKV